MPDDSKPRRSTFGKTWDQIYSDPEFVARKRAQVAAIGKRSKSALTRQRLSDAHRRNRPRTGLTESSLSSQAVLRRFWAMVRKTDTCWLWMGSADPRGYGHFGVGSQLVRAPRFSYQVVHGLLSDELVIDHLCRTPACVNPDHLEAVTQWENVRRGRAWTAPTSPSTINRNKTECIHGHPFTPENTYRTVHGRSCRQCSREAMRKHRAAR